MKLSWVGMTATAIVVSAGPVHAADDRPAISGGKGQASQTKRAAALRASAWAALGKGDTLRAVQDAENATMLLPNDAGMRALLGRAYLSAGRFNSAETAFSDALALDPALPRAAVSQALAQIALGKVDAARASLIRADGIAADADIGLAQALLGDVEGARQRLDAAARMPDADARTRQNLALAYALEGRWTDAVAVAEQDVPADVMPQRLHRWAMIAQLKSDPAMQVGAILGVLPGRDDGQPATLALVLPSRTPDVVPVPLAAAAAPFETRVSPVVQIESGAVVTAIHRELPPLEALVVKPAMPIFVPPEIASSAAEPVVLAQRAEQIAAVATPAPVTPPLSEARKPEAWAGPPRMRAAVNRSTARWASAPTAPKTSQPPTSPAVMLTSQVVLKPAAARSLGGWAVQLGAFSSNSRREIAWSKLSAQVGFLSAYSPTGSGHKLGKAMLYRLSVSGIASRKQAVNLCVRIKAAGGACFVRNMRGDEPMRWALRAKTSEPV